MVMDTTAAKIWRDALDAASESGIAFRPAANRRGVAIITEALSLVRGLALEEAAQLADERSASHADEEGEIYIARVIAKAIRNLSQATTPSAFNEGAEG